MEIQRATSERDLTVLEDQTQAIGTEIDQTPKEAEECARGLQAVTDLL